MPLKVCSSLLNQHDINDLNVERIFMPKLPPKMKKHLFLKTPKLRAHIAKQAQQLLDVARLNGPEAVQEMKSALEGGLEQLNHEADLHPLEFKKSLKELETIEAITKGAETSVFMLKNALVKLRRERIDLAALAAVALAGFAAAAFLAAALGILGAFGGAVSASSVALSSSRPDQGGGGEGGTSSCPEGSGISDMARLDPSSRTTWIGERSTKVYVAPLVALLRSPRTSRRAEDWTFCCSSRFLTGMGAHLGDPGRHQLVHLCWPWMFLRLGPHPHHHRLAITH